MGKEKSELKWSDKDMIKAFNGGSHLDIPAEKWLIMEKKERRMKL